MIKSNLALMLLAVALSAPVGAAEQVEMEQVAVAKIGAFSSELKATLKEAISKGGPANGIIACRDEAPKIAAKHSTDGWMIARRSDKNRNINNKPDAWEKAQIAKFTAELQTGKNPGELKTSEITPQEFRFAKPILMDAMCLGCHGSYLGEDVRTALKKHYPQDLATGFSPGELRGIFSVKKQL